MSKLLSLSKLWTGTSRLEKDLMAAVELTSYADRVVVPVVPVTADFYRAPEFKPEEGASIMCLDMDSLRPEQTVEWVRRATEATLRNPDQIVPCIVVVGSTTYLSEEAAEALERDLADAGAVFIQRPESQSFREVFAELGQKVSRVYAHLSYLGGGATSSRRVRKLDEQRRERWRRRSAGAPAPDLAPYVSPRHQLSDDEFEELVERVDMSENDPDFDD